MSGLRTVLLGAALLAAAGAHADDAATEASRHARPQLAGTAPSASDVAARKAAWRAQYRACAHAGVITCRFDDATGAVTLEPSK